MIRMAVIFLLLGLFFMGLMPTVTGYLPPRTAAEVRGGSGLLMTLPAPQTGG